MAGGLSFTPMTYESEMNAGFSELAAEAGTGPSALSFAGTPIVGLLYAMAGTDDLRADLKVGSSRMLFLEVSKSEIAKLSAAPRAGQAFAYGDRTLRIASIDDEDPQSITITYTVKKS